MSRDRSILAFVVGENVSKSYVKSIFQKFISDGAYVYTHPNTSGRGNILRQVCVELAAVEVALEGQIAPEIYHDSDYGIAFSDGSDGTDKIIDFIRGKFAEFKKALIVVYQNG